jgi:hypothetical protein
VLLISVLACGRGRRGICFVSVDGIHAFFAVSMSVPFPSSGRSVFVGWFYAPIIKAAGDAEILACPLKIVHMKGRDSTAILKAPPKPPENKTMQLRVQEEVRAKLRRYAEFIGSSEPYVASEALPLLFRKDDEFKIWLKDQW